MKSSMFILGGVLLSIFLLAARCSAESAAKTVPLIEQQGSIVTEITVAVLAGMLFVVTTILIIIIRRIRRIHKRMAEQGYYMSVIDDTISPRRVKLPPKADIYDIKDFLEDYRYRMTCNNHHTMVHHVITVLKYLDIKKQLEGMTTPELRDEADKYRDMIYEIYDMTGSAPTVLKEKKPSKKKKG